MPAIMPKMGAQTVAAVLDLEYRLCRLYGDAREALATAAQAVGPNGKGFTDVYDIMRAVARAQDALDQVFRHAADLDRESKGEPPF